MTDFLTIATVPYPVMQSGATEAARTYAGSVKRAFDNTLRNMTRSAKRQWTLQLAHMTQAQWETLDTAIALRAPVSCGGTMFGAAGTVTCSITATSIPFEASNLGHLRTVMLTLDEV